MSWDWAYPFVTVILSLCLTHIHAHKLWNWGSVIAKKNASQSISFEIQCEIKALEIKIIFEKVY